MSTSKNEILDSIRRHTVTRYPRPDLSALEQGALKFDDPVAHFSEVLAQVGGRAVELPAGKTVGALVAELYPEARRVANTLPALSGAADLPGEVFNPDELDEPAALNGTDVAVIAAELGVCENACCWVEERVRHRAVYFIAEALVIVLPKAALVNNMHEAYRQIPDLPDLPYACFISGPSKTADIEQALVMGAHGAREVTVVLV